MGLSFRNFLEQREAKIYNQFSQNTVGTHNDFATAAFLPSTWTGSENLGSYAYGVPSTDLSIPQTTRRSKIRSIEKNKNPIKVQLMDGTLIYLTIDEFKRVESKTKIESGAEITVVFQRRPDDDGDAPSQIVDIH